MFRQGLIDLLTSSHFFFFFYSEAETGFHISKPPQIFPHCQSKTFEGVFHCTIRPQSALIITD